MEKQTTQLSRLPKMLADLVHTNQFLKVFSLLSLLTTVLAIATTSFLGMRDLPVLTLTPSAEVLEATSPPKPEREIEKALRSYIEKRYKWGPSTVRRKLGEAKAFVLPSYIKAYESATKGIEKFAVEKQASQRVYPADHMSINVEKKVASISGDRITTIQGLRAAGDLKLELSFESGPRTQANPWGIYVTKEREE